MEHVRQAMSGINKLPNVKADGLRGMKLTETEFLREYRTGRSVVWESLTSTTTDRKRHEHLCASRRQIEIGVVIVIKATHGRDIRAISINTVEDEVLLLPGARFTVTKGARTHLGPRNNPKIKVYKVRAGRQMAAGGSPGMTVKAPLVDLWRPLDSAPPAPPA